MALDDSCPSDAGAPVWKMLDVKAGNKSGYYSSYAVLTGLQLTAGREGKCVEDPTGKEVFITKSTENIKRVGKGNICLGRGTVCGQRSGPRLSGVDPKGFFLVEAPSPGDWGGI